MTKCVELADLLTKRNF